MLNLIIADSELELIPFDMLEDYAIRKYAKKKNKPAKEIILDSNFMHGAIDRYYPGKSNRMGRPDIIYIVLQVAMESILNKKGKLRVFVHTKNNMIITINPETRIPKSYNRFVGLMEDLFKKEEIRSGDNILLSLSEGHVEDLVPQIGAGRTVVFSPRGAVSRIGEVISTDEDITAIIGGFSEGDYVSNVYDLGKSVSIYEEELTIWSVASEAIAEYERVLGVV